MQDQGGTVLYFRNFSAFIIIEDADGSLVWSNTPLPPPIPHAGPGVGSPDPVINCPADGCVLCRGLKRCDAR